MIWAFSSAFRTSSTLAARLRLAVTFAPDVKSIPRLSWLVAIEMAPIARIVPDIEKNQRLAPEKSKCQRTLWGPEPSARGECRIRERPSEPRIAWVNSTAVSSETIVPTPSVNANPFTPAVASMKRMNAVNRVMTFASMIVAMPLR